MTQAAAEHLARLANDEALTWGTYGLAVDAMIWRADTATAAAATKAIADELRANHGYTDPDDEEFAKHTKTLWPLDSPERTEQIRTLLRAAAKRAAE